MKYMKKRGESIFSYDLLFFIANKDTPASITRVKKAFMIVSVLS